MANSEQLRANKKQHQPKNIKSKQDDKDIYAAMVDTIDYLQKRLGEYLHGYQLEFKKRIYFQEMIGIIESAKLRTNFDKVFFDRYIEPDGGIIILNKNNDPSYQKIILITEAKRQGTNKQRLAEGKKQQSQGNAIERMGKNLIGIKAMLNHENITPFVCFGSGCDFNQNYTKKDGIMARISMLNEFYPLNKIHIHKIDGSSDKNYYSPVSMYFREERWTQQEMFAILKEIGETAIREYIF